MFDIGFSELLLIAVVALVVVGPKDLPVVLRHGMKFLRELRAVYTGLKSQMHQVMEDSGIHEMMQETTTIIDLEGKPQKAYDVSQLHLLGRPILVTPETTETPAPQPPAPPPPHE